jgi:competence protein ComEA
MTSRTAWAVAFGVVCGFLGAGILYLVSLPPRGSAVELAPLPTEPLLFVHVSGAVESPGLYTFTNGSRVADAVEAAGGFLSHANTTLVNLASPLNDGQRVFVPSTLEANPNNPLQDQFTPNQNNILLNINTASQTELEALPGIGPSLAARIIAYREENGPFVYIEEVQNVVGIGPAKFEAIKDLISVYD